MKSFVSPLAIAAAAALSLGSAAYAQTTVGDQDISDADLPLVTEHCAALEDDDVVPTDAIEEDADPLAGDAEAVTDELTLGDAAIAPAEGDATDVDFDAITLEDCQAAGLAL